MTLPWEMVMVEVATEAWLPDGTASDNAGLVPAIDRLMAGKLIAAGAVTMPRFASEYDPVRMVTRYTAVAQRPERYWRTVVRGWRRWVAGWWRYWREEAQR